MSKRDVVLKKSGGTAESFPDGITQWNAAVPMQS